MAIRSINFFRSYLLCSPSFIQVSSTYSSSSAQRLEDSIKIAIETKAYNQISDLLDSSKEHSQNPNPFSFLSTFPLNHKTRIIDEILQSLMSTRPRSRPHATYSFLLTHTLQSRNPLPLALAILQRILRSGCTPLPQTHLLFSSAWLDCRNQNRTTSDILMEMRSIGYWPDTSTCNYIISSHCAVGQLDEAIEVLKGMSGAGCVPNLESYGTVISKMCGARKTARAVELMKDMVLGNGLTPRPGTVVKVMAAMRANREIWEAVEVIELLERESVCVCFEAYELVVEGCLECREFVLASKVVLKMTGKGFIPYIKVRQKVVEGLAIIGEYELVRIVKQRFADLRS